jgi:hypothetical protein
MVSLRKPSRSQKMCGPVYEIDKHLVSQKAAEYDPFGAKGDKGCATCQWFISPNSCMLVQGDITLAALASSSQQPQT